MAMTGRLSTAFLAFGLVLLGLTHADAAEPNGAFAPADVVPASDPFGRVEAVGAVPGGVSASGWAIDPDTSGPIIVQMYVDGAANTMAWAGLERPDVGAVFPASGSDHGFSLSMGASAGSHTVCVYAINVGNGASVRLGCASVVVPASDPFGRVEAVGAVPGGVSASGWAIDPDTSGPIIVQMYVDGAANTMAWAGLERPDVGAVFPASGSNHGFSLSMGASAGSHTVCVYAINVGNGASVRLGCASVVVPSSDPFGSLESVEARDGMVRASGWAIDPDTTGPIIVQMYVDGSANSMVWANLSRPDVGAVHPWAGVEHGFFMEMAVGAGPHTVCVHAINTGAGASSLLGCRALAGPPFFAYGSLRPGQSGYYLLAGATTSEVNTRMPLLDLYRVSGSSYPYAVPNDGNGTGIVGDVMSIVPSRYTSVLASLDRYERYDPTAPPENQTYVRELRPTREGLPSWVYVAGPRQAAYLKASGILITSGDWLRW